MNQILELRYERLFEICEVDVVEQVCPVAKLLLEHGARLVERVASLRRKTLRRGRDGDSLQER